MYSATMATVLIGIFIAQLWLAAGRIIDVGGGAVALNEDIDPNLLNKEGDGRINVLLIGVGGAGHEGGDLSDSIMIASLDPISKELAMFSFPRDVYVPIEGYGSAKINAAHAYGEQYGYPGGGPKLLADTLTTVFDIPVHYYLRADFEGFKQAIDAVGGVDVEVEKPIKDYAYPGENLVGYEPFSLAAGSHHLDSELALKYARSRYGSSDFDRADRQQQLLLALKNKVVNLGTLLDPIKLNRLISIASGHIRTNLSVDDGLKLADLIKQVEGTSVRRANLDSTEGNLLVSRIINGSWILAPASGSFEDIKHYLRRLMPDGYIKREGANVKIINASGIDGLGRQTSKLLKGYGYNVTEVATASGNTTQGRTELIDHTDGSKPFTANYLHKRFKTDFQFTPKTANQIEDFTIILGSDYEPAG